MCTVNWTNHDNSNWPKQSWNWANHSRKCFFSNIHFSFQLHLIGVLWYMSWLASLILIQHLLWDIYNVRLVFLYWYHSIPFPQRDIIHSRVKKKMWDAIMMLLWLSSLIITQHCYGNIPGLPPRYIWNCLYIVTYFTLSIICN